MKAIMVMYDSLNRAFLQPYGGHCETPSFARLAQHAVTFDQAWVGSMPCMPARRELHTGRYNFLHRTWGPLEPFDDSMPQILRDHNIHTHLVSDHYHYWEDGGATYHQRYSTWDCVRGQEGDAWNAVVGFGEMPPVHANICGNPKDKWVEQDFANRKRMPTAVTQPQFRTFDGGLSFLKENHSRDNWFLQIETFDPHEPFFAQPPFAREDDYVGPFCDWPDYRPVNKNDSAALIAHIRNQYEAVLAMCDANLKRVLDAMDRYDLWKDTMLIVNTDHGFLLSEHGQWAKCHCPFYEEVSHTPLFVWDPRSAVCGERRSALVQTIDLPATLLEFFGLPLPPDMQGRPLRKVIENDSPIRDGVLFGLFGGQINCTDGKYLYLRSPIDNDTPRYEYTLMPTRHGGRRAFIDNALLEQATLVPPLSFTINVPVLRIPHTASVQQAAYPTALYHLSQGDTALQDASQEQRMAALMLRLLQASNCPPEQYVRMGFEPALH